MHPVIPIGYPCESVHGELEEVPEAHCLPEPRCGEEARESRYRSLNGSCNNIENPTWGATGADFIFFGQKNPVTNPTRDTVTFRSVRTDNVLPNARRVSIAIHASSGGGGGGRSRAANLPRTSIALMQFGQFLDHDLTLTPQARVCANLCGGGEGISERDRCCEIFRYQNESLPSNCWPIPIEQDDPLFGFDGNGPDCIEFSRSQVSQCVADGDDPVQFNEITHFLDASNVYGSTDEQARELRAGKRGLLRLNQFSDQTLPFHLDQCTNAGSPRPIQHPRAFQAGDVRVNENPGLQAFHTIWAMEHNRLAGVIGARFPLKSDEEVFEESRRYLIAQWQNSVFQDFLSLVLGSQQMEIYDLDVNRLSAYDAQLRPDIFLEFSTAAFRFGHTLISEEIKLGKLFGGDVDESADLVNNFFDTGLMRQKKMAKLMMGMLSQPTEEMDARLTPAVREHLFQRPNASFGSDLASLNIQRGRDHAIASYAMAREACGLSPLPDAFENGRPDEIPADLWQRLSELYESTADIELFPAGLAERPDKDGGMLGPVFSCIVASQFRNLKLGDRYFFTHANVNADQRFCDKEMTAIRKRTFRDIMCDNMGDKMQRVAKNPLLIVDDVENPLVDCSDNREMAHPLTADDLCLFNGEAAAATPVTPDDKDKSGSDREVVVLAGGFNGSSLLSSVELYSPEGGGCNVDLAPLPENRYGINLFTFEDEIFACGGDTKTKGSSCYQYHRGGGGEEDSWTKIDFMAFNFPRQMASIAKSPTTGVVFVSGGLGEGNRTMEYLDRYSGEWMIGPNLTSERLRHCMVVTDDLDMISIGGFRAGNLVESYDSFQDGWQTKDNMMHNDRHACAQIPGRKDEILIIGDRRQPTIYNAKTGVERLARGTMALNRGFSALVRINGALYAIGGEFHPTIVEKYDAQSETFSSDKVSDVLHGRSRFGHTVVPAKWFSHLDKCK